MDKIQQISDVLSKYKSLIIEPKARTRAVVALIIEEHIDGLSVLFIERSTNETDYWSGQIGFPGGKVENKDRTLRETAEREVLEEIGLDLSTCQLLGRLDDISPGGLQIVISCFVYVVKDHPTLRLEKSEIADAFWVKTCDLNDPVRASSMEFIFRNRLRKFPAIRVVDGKGQPLWGITYNLLRKFNKVVHDVVKQNQRNIVEVHNVTSTKSK